MGVPRGQMSLCLPSKGAWAEGAKSVSGLVPPVTGLAPGPCLLFRTHGQSHAWRRAPAATTEPENSELQSQFQATQSPEPGLPTPQPLGSSEALAPIKLT